MIRRDWIRAGAPAVAGASVGTGAIGPVAAATLPTPQCEAIPGALRSNSRIPHMANNQSCVRWAVVR